VELDSAREQLAFVDGVMLGRAAYQNPELLLRVDPEIFGAPARFADAFEAVDAYGPYVERELARGVRLHDMTRHLLGLFAGRPGARLFRQKLATDAAKAGASIAALREAVSVVDRTRSTTTSRPPRQTGEVGGRQGDAERIVADTEPSIGRSRAAE
jgi:tRNA-dihydrouridine synthase A